jgi:hypothetical protein
MEAGDKQHALAALPPGKTQYPLYRRLGGPQGPSGWVWKISPPPTFESRTVQPLASRYTDWGIPTHRSSLYGKWIKFWEELRLLISWQYLTLHSKDSKNIIMKFNYRTYDRFLCKIFTKIISFFLSGIRSMIYTVGIIETQNIVNTFSRRSSCL